MKHKIYVKYIAVLGIIKHDVSAAPKLLRYVYISWFVDVIGLWHKIMFTFHSVCSELLSRSIMEHWFTQSEYTYYLSTV
jgi:hypothetical protein